MWFWRKQPMLKGYVSEVDQFLLDFNQKPEASSANVRAEKRKYDEIILLRDNAKVQQSSGQIWEDL
jgi:hypothetical protein